ncbi:MAG TPA: NAD(P)H-dependent oxidoreductase subunit E [Chloroflexota bacterium]|nr:NAD(P)H-dependent oxidoreductase subunit E [Chloroflexota bacterium]
MHRGEQRSPTSGPVRPPEGHEQLLAKITAFPRQRSYLLPVMLAIQEELGWLPDWAIEFASAHLRVPKSEAYGAISSYPALRLSEPPTRLVRICVGSACRLAGATDLRRQLAEAEQVDCLFICALAPAAEVDGRLVGRATLESLGG